MDGLKRSLDDVSREPQQKRPRTKEHESTTFKRGKVIVARVNGTTSNASQVVAHINGAIDAASDGMTDCIENITIVPSCTGSDDLAALVDFKMLPGPLSWLRDGSSTPLQVPVPGSKDDYLLFDTNFAGLTQLYSTEREPTADGIGSHAYGSWVSKSPSGKMWPRHFLPKHFPDVRVMIYGHNARIRGVGFGELMDYSRSLGDALRQARQDITNRPIIFVAHSLGGNILKRFLIDDYQRGGATVKSCHGVMFFAVPHRGLNVEDLVAAIRHEGTSENILRQISDPCHWAQEVNHFVEVIKVGKWQASMKRHLRNSAGLYSRSGEYIKVLSSHSATLGLPDSLETKHPVDADHSSIVKFIDESSPIFCQVLRWFKYSLMRSNPMNGSTQVDRASGLTANESHSEKIDAATTELLNELGATNPELDMARIEGSKDTLLWDCYAWILEDSQYQAWWSGTANKLLWINGDPGKGKTMLMIALVREISNLFPVGSTSNSSPTITYFFCQGTDTRLNNAASILRGLLWKLVSKHPWLFKPFQEKYQSNKNMLDGPNAIYALFNMLSHIMTDNPNTVILIDALDECVPGPQREQLVELIKKDAKSSSKVKWLLSSRNYPDIKQMLVQECDILSLELNESHISQAVNEFIRHKVNELTIKKAYSAVLAKQVKNELMERAGATFLWVALACKQLLHFRVKAWNTLSTLNKLPPELGPLYSRMIELVLDEDKEDGGFCAQILRSVCIASRPLSMEELIHVAGLPAELLENDSLLQLCELCGSFIKVRQKVIYFIHQSAKDYLMTDGAEKLFEAGPSEEHRIVADRSLSILSKVLTRNMCNLDSPSSQARSAVIDDRLKAINYVCCYWADHLDIYMTANFVDWLQQKRYISDGGPVHKFLSEHLLHWFEALSLFRELNRGILALQKLQKLIAGRQNSPQPESSSSLDSFVTDAILVFLQCVQGIEESPLQVYISALLFAPLCSSVRQRFKEEMPTWVEMTKPQEEWCSCTMTLEGHSAPIRCLAFSPDGSQLASGGRDKTIRLWNMRTRYSSQILTGHGSKVRLLAFSPKEQLIASASFGWTIRLWDIRPSRGICVQELYGDERWVEALAFSPDGLSLISMSYNSIVIFTIKTGEKISLRAPDHNVIDRMSAMTFKDDGQLLASGYKGNVVLVWDAKTNTGMQRLVPHREYHRSDLQC